MTKEQYIEKANVFKAISDSNRLQIIDMLSKGEMCACKILEQFNITQPTLSHHMKILLDENLVIARKDGNWVHYRLNESEIKEIKDFINNIIK